MIKTILRCINLESNNFFKNNVVWMICLLVILATAYSLFQWNGIAVILGMLVLYFLSFYLIIRNFDLEEDEKIFFSFFTGIGIFPFLVYALYYLVKSLRISILITFILLVVAGIGLTFYKKKKHSEDHSSTRYQ